ncbi:MAG: FliO/MopB family protein [Thermodesulfobacteriota bacterium]
MRAFLVLLFTAAPVIAFAASADSDNLSLFPMTLKMLAALGVVIGLFLLLYALARKSRTWLPGAAAQDAINVRAVRHLGPKRALYLVDVDGRRFFISASGEQIRLLSEWDPPQDLSNGEPEGTDEEGRTSFAALLQRQFRGKKNPVSEADSKLTGATAYAESSAKQEEDKPCPGA